MRFEWFKSRTSSQDQETKASQKKNFEKKKCTFLMINVTNSTVKLTLASVVTLNNFTSIRYNNAHTAVIVTLSTPDHL